MAIQIEDGYIIFNGDVNLERGMVTTTRESAFLVCTPQGGVGALPPLVKEESLFSKYIPTPDQLKAVKLTKDNIDYVAAYIRKVAKLPVEASSDGIVIGRLVRLPVGQWIVEVYNYENVSDSLLPNDSTYFRAANLEERRKYGLK